MSMQKFMHPRNIYKNPPNFKQLAIQYPEFRKFVSQQLDGKIKLDFKNAEALRALACTLLEKDFDLKVEMPLNKLIPTIPLRLNYLLWIEDLMEISDRKDHIIGVDVGTGASCIYPLLAVKKNGWRMLATEIDENSVEYANKNVQQNNLQHLITVKRVNEREILANVCLDDEIFDFCMCNPPFFATQQETIFEFKSRKANRARPKNAFCASLNEIVVNGGEIDFITKLIKESKVLSNKIRVFTTMVGQKASLSPLKKLLRELDVISFKQTEFCQGNTTRWGLAWTYYDIDLRKVPHSTLIASRKTKNKNSVMYTLTNTELDIENIATEMTQIFAELQIVSKSIKNSRNVIAYNLIAHSNTWSHQRRKRREMQRTLNNSTTNSSDSSHTDNSNTDVEDTANLISEMNVQSPLGGGGGGSISEKRQCDEELEYYKNKKMKIEATTEDDVNKVYLECSSILRKDPNGIHIELIWIDGRTNKDSLHQILQYIKNNLKV